MESITVECCSAIHLELNLVISSFLAEENIEAIRVEDN